MTEPAENLTGHCMCGTVEFKIDKPLLGAAICHCKRCQRRTGSDHSVTGLTQPGSFEITAGEPAVSAYIPEDDGWHKFFCQRCGGQLFTRHPEDPDLLAVRMGALDQDPGVRPGAHQFVAYAAPWEDIPDDGLPRFEERLSWKDD